jgi:CHAT domain-containing protein
VFLGACETGSGKWYNGEGIISLARSFLYAGARSIVTTLWSINDESNKKLTTSFFRHLHEGERKDEALRHAKLEQLEHSGLDLYAHPVFWAAYTPIGNMEPVKSKTKWWYYLAGLGLAGLVVYYAGRFRRKGVA